MTMMHIFKELVKRHGFNPNIIIKKEHGMCEYAPSTDTIILRLGGRRYDEQVFSLLHEYRHCIQRNTLMFDMFNLPNPKDIPNNEAYFNLPWEKDANEWATAQGIEMGFFLEGYKPRWLANPNGGW